MADTILIIISIFVGLIYIGIAFFQYKKDRKFNNPQAVSKLGFKILILVIVVIALQMIVVPVINHFKPRDQVVTKKDIKELMLSMEKPRNPSIEEVESELEREIKAALEKQKEKALGEYQRGNEAYNNNFYEVAITHFENAIKVVKIPSFYLALGNSYYVISQYEQAQRNYKNALKLYKESGEKKGEASALGNIGVIYQNKGNLDNALKYLQQALVIEKEIGYKQGEAITLGNIGLIYQDKGDLDNALKYHQQALVIDKEIGYKQGEADQLGNIGLVYKNKGDLDNALKYLQQAKDIFTKIDAKSQLQIVQKAISEIEDADKKLEIE